MRLPAAWLLVTTNVWAHLGRFLAACLAISCATAILLAALVGQQLVCRQAPTAAQSLLGENELHLAATDTIHPVLSGELLEAIRADPRVSRVRLASTVRAVDMAGTEAGGLDTERFYSLSQGGAGGWIPGRREAFMAWHGDEPVGELSAGDWPSPEGVDPVEIVVPTVIWGQPVGSWRRLESDTGVYRARVVGTLPADGAAVTSAQGVRLASRQISLAAAERLAGAPIPPSDARVELHRAEDATSFRNEWQDRLGAYPGRIELWDAAFIEHAALNSPTAEGARLAVQSATLLAAACVVCIAFSVQGNAVRERAAQLSLLRSLGATPALLPAIVILEAVLLALASVAGAALVVWAAMAGLSAYLPMLGVLSGPDLSSLARAGLVTLLGVVAGAAWPAYVASRTLPGEFVAREVEPSRAARAALWSAGAGLLIAALCGLAIVAAPPESYQRAQLITWLGVPGLALTAVLLTPLVIRATCRVFAAPIARLTGTEPLVLSDHVASDGTRSAGSVIAISIGLGGFIWMLCWGASMLDAFIIDPAMPRWLVSIHPYGLNEEEADRLLAAPGFDKYHPLTLFDTHLTGTDEPTPTLILGVDVARSLAAGPSGLPFQFQEGNRDQAIAQLKQGDACLVSAWYAASHGVHVGDSLSVATPSADGRGERTYRVAGVVELKGWRMATKLNKVRRFGLKHEVMLVLDADAARRDFPVATVNFLLGNPDANTDGSLPGFRNDLPEEEAYAASRSEREAVEAAVDLSQPVSYASLNEGVVVAESRLAQVDDLDRTRASLRGEWGGGAVKRLGQAPLFILALSLFSVCGALIVSFQSRSRELGVLRSCGMTRWELARLALAEALLLGIASVPIAALLGGVGAWLMLKVASVVGYRLDFAGIQPEFLVPWSWMWPGVVVTLLVCCIAAAWAAWRVGRIAPATLISSSSRG